MGRSFLAQGGSPERFLPHRPILDSTMNSVSVRAVASTPAQSPRFDTQCPACAGDIARVFAEDLAIRRTFGVGMCHSYEG
jgi:hypothetical protein